MIKLYLSFALLLTLNLTALAQESSAKLEGQIVCCVECWTKADRTKVEYGTAEDLLRAKSCVEGGDPTLLAVREGEKFAFYQLEPGKFRLPGENWLEFVGQKVAVTGTVRQMKKARIVRVDTLDVIAQSRAARDAAEVVGREVELTLKDLFGAEQHLSRYQGRVVVLNFWATYCAPCRREMPDLAAVQNEYAALGVQVIGASADESGDRDKVLQFIRETKLNFPILLGATSADMIRFGLGTALPGTVVIGRDGRVVKVFSGVINRADLKKEIDQLLASAAATAARGPAAPASERPAKASAVPS